MPAKDHYIVTLKVSIKDGPPETIRYSTYGMLGMADAVQTVDWDVRKGHASYGRVDRILASGSHVPVYERPDSHGGQYA